MFASVAPGARAGRVAVGATIYFGSAESKRQIQEVSDGVRRPRTSSGMATVLWCYLRNSAFNRRRTAAPTTTLAADLTGQANHLGVTIEADIIKQKPPETAAPGFLDLKFGKTDKRVYSELTERPPDRHDPLPGGQLLHGPRRADQLGRRLAATSDLHDAVHTAVVNKRAGGMGLISGRKAFQRPMAEGIELLNAIQDVYLCDEVTIA